MNMEMRNYPALESADIKLKKEINTKLSELLKKGTPLADIVELLDAQEFLEYIEPGKKQSPVAHFDVDGFIKKRISENRKFSLPEEYIKIDETILPPSEMEIRSGDGTGFKEAGMIPRSTMLMETLTELGLKYSVIEGQNDPKMVRKLSYLVFIVPSMQKLVLVNDEEANATFIIHKAKSEEWKYYINKTKDELYVMPHDLLSSIKYPHKNKENHQGRWKDKIKYLLINGAQQINDPTKNVEAPEGWSIAYQVSKKCGFNDSTVRIYAEKYRAEHPEWFKKYRNRPGRLVEYYSPELIDIISNDIKQFKTVPDNWMAIRTLRKELGTSKKTLNRYVESYKLEHPEWFRMFESRSRTREMHYHPDLVKLIQDKFKNELIPIDGWLSSLEMVKTLNSYHQAVKLRLEDYKISHPEWFKKFKNKRGQISAYYSPELVEILREKISKNKDAKAI